MLRESRGGPVALVGGAGIGEDDYCALAHEAMAAVYRKPVADRHIDSPTFCHGVAGLLQITLRFAIDTGLPIYRQEAARLADQLIAAFEPETILGYRSIEHTGDRIDNPALLDSAPGVAMVLLASSCHPEPTWDRFFLLS